MPEKRFKRRWKGSSDSVEWKLVMESEDINVLLWRKRRERG